jgi:thiamine pyrophosphate-dependent acetolactate synthase large subunit-like protein
MNAENDEFVHKVFRSKSQILPSNEEIDAAVRLVDDSRKVAILAGEGCRNARSEVLALAKRLQAPITTSLKAVDIFDRDSDNVVGLNGLIGNPSGYQAVFDCDLLLMLGTDFPYPEFLPHDVKTIQVDINPANIGNRTSVTLGLHGDILPVAKLLNKRTAVKKDMDFLNSQRDSYLKWKKSMDEEADTDSDLTPMHPQIIAKLLSDKAADDAIFVVDTGASAIWASNFMSFHGERRVIGSFNHGSMAVGLPAAIGAQLQYPDREVWAIVGDGAFNMSQHDFATAVAHNLPIKIIVLNNGELAFVKIEMEEAGLAPNLQALNVNNFDFAEYANLCGGKGFTVKKPGDAILAVDDAKKVNKPVIINAFVNSGELSLPPKIGLKEMKNFSVSKVRELMKAANGNKRQWDNLKKEFQSFFD